MSAEVEKPKSVTSTIALTERLRRAATVSDAGPMDGQSPDTDTPDQQDKSDHEIILELNQAIQEIIADAPLAGSPAATNPVPGQHPNPQHQRVTAAPPPPLHPTARLASLPAAETRYLVAGPGDTLHTGTPNTSPLPLPPADDTSHLHYPTGAPAGYLPAPNPHPQNGYDDDGDLQHWLARPSDDQPEPRSRTRVVALCAGTMILSILAGYGSAQMLNGYGGAEGPGAATLAKVADTFGEAAPADTDADGESDNAQRVVRRVTTLPVASADETLRAAEVSDVTARQPFRVASISGFGGTVPEPAPAHRAPAIPTENTSVEPPILPPTEPEKTTTNPIPQPDQERLFTRANELIGNRDIAAARLMLRHLAEAGNGSAALKLAQTYDAEWLRENDAADVPANDDMALRWYSMARERGEQGFEARIEALSKTVRASN